MPSKHTFTIAPIQELLSRYVPDGGKGFIDPFAGYHSPAEITNDLNPATPATYHMHALEFVQALAGEYDGCLFDPPYSLRQLKECYQSIGYDFMSSETTQFPHNIKRALSRVIKPGGIVISCGWSSNGLGATLGFDLLEVMLVAHGGAHNDTIVTVERKTRPTLF